ncbi:MAG: YggT family protein [Gammaproteobacteria bacterium]|nr:YggT family protein [Gammaproteobacteria bacterium]MDH5593807.1 YggT family protein [Gammaproteobacteria bacterium]
MGNDYLTNPLVFLISTLFDLYILVVMLRFIFQLIRADFYNPLSQFIVKVTSPLLIPLRRVIPSVGKIDTSCVVLLIVLQLIKLSVIGLLSSGMFTIGMLLVLAVAETVSLVFNIFVFGILIQVILSWINPGSYNPITAILYSLTEPVLGPFRRLIPPIAGFDLSPIAALLALQIAKMLVIPPIVALARSFAG